MKEEGCGGRFQKSGKTLPALLDTDQSAGKRYGLTGVPETFVIDKKGVILKKVVGAMDWSRPELSASHRNSRDKLNQLCLRLQRRAVNRSSSQPQPGAYMMDNSNITFVGAFIAGLLSFLSPLRPSAHPFLYDLYYGPLLHRPSGRAPDPQGQGDDHLPFTLFIAGFTTVFVLLGASATYIGGFLQAHMGLLRKIGGVLIVIFGIHVTGIFDIGILLGEKRLSLHRKPAGYLGSFIVGVAFAAGWTPCIGPILASILMVAATEETVYHGIALLLVYSIGLGLPFFLASLAMHQFLVVFNRFKKYIRIFEIVTGVFLIIVGVLILTDYLSVLSRYTNILMERM